MARPSTTTLAAARPRLYTLPPMWFRIQLFAVVVLCGAVIMALEILSSRLLAPQFGSSVYVWGSIISVFLAALSLGYYFGGRLADRQPRLEVLGRVILLAALGQAALLAFGHPVVAVLGEWTGGSPGGTLIATSILFGPVSVLLAMVSPFAIRLATHDLQNLGNTAGQLAALSTFGSLLGTLGCTFVLIPYLRFDRGLGLLILLTVAAALAGLVAAGRKELPAIVLALVLVVYAGYGKGRRGTTDSGLLHVQTSPYQTLEVYERGGARYLRSNRVLHSAIWTKSGEPALSYARYSAASLLWQPEPRSMLVLGMGGGTVGSYLQQRLPRLQVDYVEIDPAVAELAESYLGFRSDERTRVHLGDARRFLSNSTQSWDLIYNDTYIGASVPFHLATSEYVAEVKAHLNPGGVFGLNMAGSTEDPFVKAIYITLRQHFRQLRVFACRPGPNLFVIATDAEHQLSAEELLVVARQLDSRLDFDPSLEEIVDNRYTKGMDLEGALVLSDRYAPTNWLVGLNEQPSEVLNLGTATEEDDESP